MAVDPVAGVPEIQEVLENTESVSQAANAASSAPHLRLSPLSSVLSVAAFAIGAHRQIATLFGSNGKQIVDPDGAGPRFEVPIVPSFPEDLSFIP